MENFYGWDANPVYFFNREAGVFCKQFVLWLLVTHTSRRAPTGGQPHILLPGLPSLPCLPALWRRTETPTDIRGLCIRPVNISIPKKASFLTKGSIPASQQVPVMGITDPSPNPNALCTFKERLLIMVKERMWYYKSLFSMPTCLGLKCSQICSHNNKWF